MNIRAKLNPYAYLRLRRQLYLECRAMAEYAFAKGKTVPTATIRVIENFEAEIAADEKYRPPGGETMMEEAPVVEEVARHDIEDLVQAHVLLVKIVEPATPKTILLLDMEQETPGFWKLFGPVPLVRHMMLVALVSLLLFAYFVSSTSPTPPGSTDPISLRELLFVVASACMGASFVALYSANGYITAGTFDPAYYASYWIRFLLGVMSGVVLATMISDKATGLDQNAMINPTIFRPLLAILGGFSADLVYTFLNRMVETFKSLFEGSAKSMLEAQAEEARARQESRMVQNRMKLAADLLRLQQEMGSEAQPQEIQAKLTHLLQSLMPEEELQLGDRQLQERRKG